MEQLIGKLNSLPNSYFEFVDSTLDYAKSDPSHLTLLMNFFEEHEKVTVSDVIYFISCQPDFFEDDVEAELVDAPDVLLV